MNWWSVEKVDGPRESRRSLMIKVDDETTCEKKLLNIISIM